MNIKQQAVSGMLWMGGARLATQFLDQLFTIVLVRLLAPGDFGLMAMAAVFTTLFNMFADMGLARAVVQRVDIDDEYLSTAFWANLAGGVVLCLVALGAAIPISLFYNQPLVRPIFAALSLRVVFAGASGVQLSLLTRKMRFSTLTSRNVTSIILGGAVGVGMARSGFGVWSLIGQTLTTGFSQMVLLWLAASWYPKWRFSWEKFKDLWGFGGRIMGSRFFNYVIKQSDNMLIGRMLGATQLGYYAFGYGMFLAPLVDVSLIVGRVAFSAFARLQENIPKLRAAFLMTTRYLSFFAFPALLGFFLIAPDLVAVVFGQKWLPSVPVLRVLLIAGVLQSHTNIWAAVFQAMGRADWLLKWSFVSACIYVPAFLIGVRWGIVGVATGYLASTLLLVPVQLRLVQILLGFRMRDYLATMVTVTAASAFMGICVFLAQVALQWQGVHAPVRLVLAILVGMPAYGVAMLVMQREMFIGLLHMVVELRRRRVPSLAKGAI